MTGTTSIQHVNLLVDDLAAADTFYADVLGFARAETPQQGFPSQFYDVTDGQQLHVNEMNDLRPERAHFCVRLERFNEVFHRCLELGIVDAETWGKVRRLPTGVMQAFVRDPSGNLIELACDADQAVDPAILELDIAESEPAFYTPPDAD